MILTSGFLILRMLPEHLSDKEVEEVIQTKKNLRDNCKQLF